MWLFWIPELLGPDQASRVPANERGRAKQHQPWHGYPHDHHPIVDSSADLGRFRRGLILHTVIETDKILRKSGGRSVFAVGLFWTLGGPSIKKTMKPSQARDIGRHGPIAYTQHRMDHNAFVRFTENAKKADHKTQPSTIISAVALINKFCAVIHQNCRSNRRWYRDRLWPNRNGSHSQAHW